MRPRFSPKPKKLYKYLSAEGAKALFLEPSLWFSLSNKLNDVFDLRPVGSFVDEFGQIAVFCLSETPLSRPMWAHYGSMGQGVVLEFDLNSDFFAQYPPSKVLYRSKRPTVSDPKAIIIKSSEWAYEREWRCFTPLAKELRFLESHQVVSVPFPFAALTSVIYGHDSRVNAQDFLARSEASHTFKNWYAALIHGHILSICESSMILDIFSRTAKRQNGGENNGAEYYKQITYMNNASCYGDFCAHIQSQ